MSNQLQTLKQSNPNGIVTAPQGSIFTRSGDRFFLVTNGVRKDLNVTKKTFAAEYKNEIWYPTATSDSIAFATTGETWLKVYGNDKTGWAKTTSKTSIAKKFVLPAMGDIVNVWVGYDHSYFLKKNGELWVSGYNGNDYCLGLGINDYRVTASLALTDVKYASGGVEAWNALALKNDGTLWGTGWNYAGNFGDGAITQKYEEWTQLDLQGDITASGNIIDIENFGYNEICAVLLDDNTMWISTNQDWYFGLDSGNVFVQVASDVKKMSGGAEHFLYLKNDNTLWGIGQNWGGQLGTGDDETRNYDNPYQIASNVKDFAAGGYHSAYILNDGTLWTMGANWDGALGNGSRQYYFYTASQIDTDVKFVNGGDEHTLYIKNDDTLYGAGGNWSAQLGIGTYQDAYTPVEIDTDVSIARGGGEFSLYVKKNKMLYGMGDNTYWQLGFPYAKPAAYSEDLTSWSNDGIEGVSFNDHWNDSIYADGKFIAVGYDNTSYHAKILYSLDAKTWTPATLPDSLPYIISVSYASGTFFAPLSQYGTSSANMLTSTDGINWTTGSTGVNFPFVGIAYGNNTFVGTNNFSVATSSDGFNWEATSSKYQVIGKPRYLNGVFSTITNLSEPFQHIPNYVRPYGNITASMVGAGENNGVIIDNGVIGIVGFNAGQQAGLPTFIERSYYYNPIDTNARSLSVGNNYTTYVKNDNTLWGIGYNNYGQLGTASLYATTGSPRLIDSNVSQSFCNSKSWNTYYIKNDGTLWGCGPNWNGGLGSSSFGSYVYTPILIDSNVKYASQGSGHVLYIKNDNTLWGLGYNAYGQLGNGTNTTSTQSIQIDTDVTSCFGAGYSSFYIKTGSLYGMGGNSYGNLGLGDSSNRNVPTYITSSAKYISGTDISTLMISDSGQLYGSGDNLYGKFGTGNDSGSNVFVTSSLNDVNMVSIGYYFSYALKNNGEVYVAGIDSWGGMGLLGRLANGAYSADGINWSTSFFPNYCPNYLNVGNEKLVAVIENTSRVSTDGINWIPYYTSKDYDLSPDGMTFGNGKFVLWSNGDVRDIAYSTDGQNWSTSTTGNKSIWGILVAGDGKYIAIANDAIELESTPKKIEI